MQRKGLSVGLLSQCYLAGQGLCQCGQLRQSTTMTGDQTTVESCVVRVSHSLSVSLGDWSITRQRTQSDQIFYITVTQNKNRPTANYFPEKTLEYSYSTSIVLDTCKKIDFLSLNIL